jgi:hypothetical protein
LSAIGLPPADRAVPDDADARLRAKRHKHESGLVDVGRQPVS